VTNTGGSIETRDEFRAGGKLEPYFRVDTSLNNILLRGLRVDTIKSTKGTPFNDWKPNPWLPESIEAILLAENYTARIGKYPFTDDSYTLAFLEVLTTGHGRSIIETDIFTFQEFSMAGDFEINHFNPYTMMWNEVYKNLAWSTGEWDVFESEIGYLGLGPTSMQPGDSLCIFGSRNVPLILRPLEEHGGYQLVGECYIHGVMHGEATEGVDGDQLEEFLLW
jgi:hypothetical protein